MTRRVQPLCAVLVVAVAVVVLLFFVDAAEARRGGRAGRTPYIGGAGAGAGRGNRSSNGGHRGVSGGTWAACVGSSLLAAAAVLL
ncbi:hypothetical protein ACP4OV_019862 [Aristida adscensionis]